MDTAEKALLPAGLQDLLAPEAAQEATVIERLIAAFAACGYERVKPPLMEFEETLFSSVGSAVAQESFRLMDPVSQRMMALRADITPQIVRIAATRLKAAPRPLRLCYAGQVLRTRGGQLRPERQFAQAGVELIGAVQETGDAEVVVLAASALEEVGVENLTVDLSVPTLVPVLAESLGLDPEAASAVRQALDRKDAAAVAGFAEAPAELFHGLLRAAGPADRALSDLRDLPLPAPAREEVNRLARVAAGIGTMAPGLDLTVDPVEHRGFEYQTGLSFTLFARGVRGELGRGGRYMAGAFGAGAEGATGFTLYMDSVLRALPTPRPEKRVFVPAGGEGKIARGLRAEGWVTVCALEPVADLAAEARRLSCSHLFLDGRVREL